MKKINIYRNYGNNIKTTFAITPEDNAEELAEEITTRCQKDLDDGILVDFEVTVIDDEFNENYFNHVQSFYN